MTLNSSSTNTMSFTTTDAVYKKPADSIEKESPNNPEMIKIQFQTFLFMMMLNNWKHEEKIITV